jgi:hypothetical protein
MVQSQTDRYPNAVKADAELKRCILECQTCETVCLETLSHCLSLGGPHANPEHISALVDCAMICTTSAAFMARGSAQHAKICGVCADLCQRCAESCEEIGDDATMKACAETCHRCAESCRKMASAS